MTSSPTTTFSVWRPRITASSTGRTASAGACGAKLRIDSRSFLSRLIGRLWSGPRLLGRGDSSRAEPDEMSKNAGDGGKNRHQPHAAKDGPGKPDGRWNLGVGGQAIPLGMIPMCEHGDHHSSCDTWRIVNPGVSEAVGLELTHALSGERKHRVFGSKV